MFSERKRQAARLARWRDTEMAEIFDREARKRFDDQHLQNRHKVSDVTCLLVAAHMQKTCK